MAGTMEKIKAKVENVLHKDKSHTHSDPTGPHDTHAANKADPRVDSDHVGGIGNTHGTGAGSGLTGHNTTHGTTGHSSGLTGNNHGTDPTGPHDSHMANKADPRVDSDRVGGFGNTGSAGGHTSALTGNTGHSSGLTGNTYGSDPTGPHDSHMANKADPRVDSDRVGGYGNTTGAGGHSNGLTGTGHSTGYSTGTTGGLTGHSTGHNTTGNYGSDPTGYNTTGNYGSDPTGPHDSNLANKLDPRVDSTTTGSYGNTGAARVHTYGSDPTGPHDSHLGNRADPRVDSSTTGGYGNTHGAGGYGANTGTSGLHGGPGPAPDTAGPHKSDMLNKVDPRVDSDLDGSKTYMGNKTSGI